MNRKQCYMLSFSCQRTYFKKLFDSETEEGKNENIVLMWNES